MAAHWMWWILGVVLIGAELLTGTFYFFALGLAFLACGAIAWLGATLPVQLIAASVLGLIGVYVAHHWRQHRGTPPAQPGLDIGQSVVVDRWQPDGTARVTYRGTQWTAELARPDRGVVAARSRPDDDDVVLGHGRPLSVPERLNAPGGAARQRMLPRRDEAR